MTAPEDTHAERHNSGSRQTAIVEQLALEYLERQNNWSTRERMASDLGLTIEATMDLLATLVEEGQIVRVPLSKDILVVRIPNKEINEALVELSDSREIQWRRQTEGQE